MQNLKKNILFVSHYPHYKMGGQQSMLALINNLDRNLYDIHVLCPAGDELTIKLREMNVKVLNLNLTAPKYKLIFTHIYQIICISNYIKKHKIDIVHPDSEDDVILVGLAKYLCKFKLIWHVRLTSKHKFDKYCLRFSDFIIGISDGVKKRFPNLNLANYQTIFNGVDCNIFKPTDDKIALRKILNLQDKFIVLFVGQIKSDKGICDLIDAMNLFDDENIILYIIGTYANVYFQKQIEESISDTNNIEILTQKDNINDFMAAADVLILPSYEGSEGMGRVLFEAMACGTPVIGTNISGINEAIDYNTGFLIDEHSPEQIKNSILKFYHDKEHQKKYSDACLTRAKKIFDIKIHTKEVMKVYERI